MTSRTRRRIRWTAAGAVLAAAGLVVGYYKAAFFLPDMTAHKLSKIKPVGPARRWPWRRQHVHEAATDVACAGVNLVYETTERAA